MKNHVSIILFLIGLVSLVSMNVNAQNSQPNVISIQLDGAIGADPNSSNLEVYEFDLQELDIDLKKGKQVFKGSNDEQVKFTLIGTKVRAVLNRSHPDLKDLSILETNKWMEFRVSALVQKIND